MSKLCLQPAIPNACRASGRGLQPKGIRIRETADFSWHQSCWKWRAGVTIKGPSKCSFASLSQCVQLNLTAMTWVSSHSQFWSIYPRELSQRLEALSAPCRKETDGLVMSALDVGTVLDWQPHIMLGLPEKEINIGAGTAIWNGYFFFFFFLIWGNLGSERKGLVHSHKAFKHLSWNSSLISKPVIFPLQVTFYRQWNYGRYLITLMSAYRRRE